MFVLLELNRCCALTLNHLPFSIGNVPKPAFQKADDEDGTL
ncbi:hypothetical protein N9Z87_00370 [Amylibacter sp.]|nr:hypothetical protein [Amylibacter sp.]